MRREEEVRLTHSGIFAKDGRRCVSVRFERGRDVAEAILPACRVTKNEGFTDEEVRGLEQYLESKNDEIFAKAKEINPIRGILYMPSLPFAHSRDACGGGTAKRSAGVRTIGQCEADGADWRTGILSGP